MTAKKSVMTAQISLIWVVMTLAALACAVPAQVMTETTAPTVVMTTYPKTVMTASVTASQSLNVRERAGWQQIRVLGVLSHGDTVTLTGTCDRGWAEIVWKGGTAWVNADFLSSNKCSENE